MAPESEVIKVRLADLTQVLTLTITGTSYLNVALIDSANGFAYFSGPNAPIFKVRLSDLTTPVAISGITDVGAGVIDPANGYAYFGTFAFGMGGKVIRVRLSDFVESGTLYLPSPENSLAAAVLDSTHGFAYFSTATAPGVVKVRLADLARVSSLTLNAGETGFGSAVIDETNGFAYFGGANLSAGQVIKVRLSDFSRAGTLAFDAGESPAEAAVIDSANGFAYFGAGRASVVKVRLADFTRVSGLNISGAGVEGLASAVIDAANGFAYFASDTDESHLGVVAKIRLSDFTQVGTLILDDRPASAVARGAPAPTTAKGQSPSIPIPRRNSLPSAVIDTVNGFAYFGTSWWPPGKVVKVRLSDFTEPGVLTLNTGEDRLVSAAIDSALGYAYFGTLTGRVVKIDLATFTRIDSLTLNADEGSPTTVVFDSGTGFLYLGTDTSPASVIQVVSPPLILSSSPSLTSVQMGDALTYAYSLSNTSLASAANVILTSTLPLSVRFNAVTPGSPTCSPSAGQVICNLGSVAAKSNVQVTIQATVQTTTTTAMFNTAVASGSDPRFSMPVRVTSLTIANPWRTYFPLLSK